MTGRCLLCPVAADLVGDHPEGRYLGVPLFGRVVPLCKRHNAQKGRVDRAAGVEGGVPTVRLVLRRLAAYHAFLALEGSPVLMPAGMLSDTAAVLEKAALMVPADIPWPMP